MSDFLLTVGADIDLSFEQMRKDIETIAVRLGRDPVKIKLGFDIDESAKKASSKIIQDVVKPLGDIKKIKIPNILDDLGVSRKLSNDIEKVSVNATNAAKSIGNMTASLRSANISDIESTLREISGISPSGAMELAESLRKADVNISSIRARWKEVGDEQQNVLSLTVKGKNEMGQAVQYIVNYDKTTGEIESKFGTLVTRFEEIKTSSAGSNEEIEKTNKELSEASAKLKEIQVTNSAITSGYRKSITSVDGESTEKEAQQIEVIKGKYIELQTATNLLRRVKNEATTEDIDNIHKLQKELQALIDLRLSEANSSKKSAKVEQDKDIVEKKYYATIDRQESALRNWTAAKKSVNAESRVHYDLIEKETNRLKDIFYSYTEGKTTLEELNTAIAKSTTTFTKSKGIIRENEDATKSFTDRLGNLTSKFSAWLTVSKVVMTAYRTMKNMVSAVIELDTAMTELKKVTDETNATYEKFLHNATTRAKDLGATLTDTITASADFARLGYGMGDAEKLADAAIVYKNVGDGITSIGEASSSVIATMQAFGVEAADVMNIVDKFNEVGNRYAISAKGVGEALLRSAAALKAANNSLDESVALATAANVVVQDPEKVGTTLRTLTMFLRAAKTEVEEAGESTDGMASSVSKLRDELLRLTGNRVDIMIDDDTFKSTFQILRELSGVWKDLSDVSQANILERIGGKRNANVVSALLENFTTAENVLQTSAESAGSALAENEKYLESIQGRISIFKVSFEELSSSVVNSDIIKFVINLGTQIVGLATKANELKLLLPMILSSVIAIKGVRISKSIVDSAAGIQKLTETLISQGEVTESVKVAFKSLSAIEKKMFAEKIIASQALDKAQKAQILSILGLSTAGNTLTGTNYSLAASFKTLMASIPLWGQIAMGISIAITAITAISAVVKNSKERVERLDSEFKELLTSIKSVSDGFKELKGSANDVIPRFVELAKGVDSLGKNLSLTQEEYDEFWELNNRLADMFPELNAGVDANGNSILALSYTTSGLNVVLDELLEKYRNLANIEIADSMGDVAKNIEKRGKAYNKEIKILENRREELKRAGKVFHSNIEDMELYKDKITEVITSDDEGEHGKVIGFYTDLTDGDLEVIDGQIDAVKGKIDSAQKDIVPILSAWLQTDAGYSGASEEMQAVLSRMVANLDYSKIEGKTPKGMKKFISKTLIEPITNAEPEVQDAVALMFDAKSAFDSGKIDVRDFNIARAILEDVRRMEGAEDLANTLDEMIGISSLGEKINLIKDKVPEITDGFIEGLSSKELELVYSIVSKESGLSIDDVKEKLAELKFQEAEMVMPLDFTAITQGLEQTASSVDKITSAMAKLSEGTQLSKKEMMDLVTQFPQLLEQADLFANGTVESQKNALNSILDMYEQEYDAKIDAEIAKLEATLEVLQDQIGLEEDKASAILEVENKKNAATEEERAGLVNAIRDLNDLEGRNYVSMQEGQLEVNEEALNENISQGVDFGEEVTDQVWKPVGDVIVKSTEAGASGSLKSLSSYLSKAVSWVGSAFKGIGKAIKAGLSADWSSVMSSLRGAFSGDRDTSVSGGDVVVEFGGSKTTVDSKPIDEWISDQKRASATRIKQVEEIKANTQIAIDNLNSLKGLKLTDIYASTGSGKSGGGKSGSGSKAEEDNLFKRMYDYHNYLVSMEKETVSDYLNWLDDAYKAAYKQGEITLNEYYKYQIEVFKGLRDLFKDYISDVEHEIAMRGNYKGESKKIIALYKGLLSSVEKEIKASRARGLTDTDEYIQSLQSKWQSYTKAIEDIRKEAEDGAKNSVKELINIRINMIKQDIKNEKDAISKKLEYLRDFYKKQKQLLQDSYDEERYLEDQAEKRKAVSKIQVELDQLELDSSAWAQRRKLELAEELHRAQKDLSDFERDRALKDAQEHLDKLQEAQEKELDAQVELLDAKQENAKVLYDQALEDIRNGSIELYEEMISWNQIYGDGIDETIKTAWENAYVALEDYHNLFNKHYESIKMVNATGYVAPKETWDNSVVSAGKTAKPPATSTSSKSKGTTTSTSSGSKTATTSKSKSPSLSPNSSITVKKTATHFSSKSKGVKMASFVPGGKYTVYQTSGSEVLIGRNGVYTGWIKKNDIVGYASGTKSAIGGMHEIDEIGSEYLFTSSDGNKYRVLNSGDKVLNAKATDFLYDFANSSGKVLKDAIKDALGVGLMGKLQTAISHNKINMGDIIVKGSADSKTVSEIRRAQRDNLSDMLKSLNELNK